MVLLNIINNENHSACLECGGACCESSAGIYHPAEVMLHSPKERLRKLLGNKWAIDSWEGDPRPTHDEHHSVFFIRPRHKHAQTIIDYSWGGKCVYLTKKGCRLIFKNRPVQCRALIPAKKTGERCDYSDEYTKQNLSIVWLEYQHIIHELINEVTEFDQTNTRTSI